MSNQYTNPLIANWKLIRDQYWDALEVKGMRKDGQWLDNNIYDKPNSIITTTDQVELYTGKIKTTPVMIKHNMLDKSEKAILNWGENETTRWVKSIESSMKFMWRYCEVNFDNVAAAVFNTAMPNSKLSHHWGLDGDYFRLHLCIDEVDGAVFNIEGWERGWKNGELFAFDDANVFHGTVNRGSEPRSILVIDIKKTALLPFVKNYVPRIKPPKDQWNLIKDQCNIIK